MEKIKLNKTISLLSKTIPSFDITYRGLQNLEINNDHDEIFNESRYILKDFASKRLDTSNNEYNECSKLYIEVLDKLNNNNRKGIADLYAINELFDLIDSASIDTKPYFNEILSYLKKFRFN